MESNINIATPLNVITDQEKFESVPMILTAKNKGLLATETYGSYFLIEGNPTISVTESSKVINLLSGKFHLRTDITTKNLQDTLKSYE